MSTSRLEDPEGELPESLRRRTQWKTIVAGLLLSLCLLGSIVWFGRGAVDEVEALAAWVASHGIWGKVAFVVLSVVLTSVFVPEMLFAASAGALFGLWWGTVLTVLGVILTAVVDYLLALTLLRPRIESLLEGHPKLRAIRDASNDEGIRLQLLLRVAPINPVSTSYVLGASGVRFPAFLGGTLGMIPWVFAEVYFGYLASHVTRVVADGGDESKLKTGMVAFGFVVCIALIVYVTRIAVSALAAAEDEAAVASEARGD